MARGNYLRPLAEYREMGTEEFIAALDRDLTWAEREVTYDLDDDGDE